MSRETKVPSIPEIRDDNVKEVLQAVKNTVLVREGNIGDPLDQGATLRDLVALNLAEEVIGGATTSSGSFPVSPVLPPPISGYNPSTDYTTPPAPINLRASGGFTNVFLEWDGAPYRNHNFTEIWRATVDSLGDAVLVGTTAANVYADPVNANQTYYYWIRFVSKAAVTGPYNQTSGTPATTALDVTGAITAISEDIQNSQLFADLGSRIARAQTGIQEVRELTATTAAQVNTLSSQVGSNTATIQTQARVTDGISAQYTVKIDNNGYVSGFGLASTPVNGVPRSSFQVRADSFAIAPASAPEWQFSSVYDKNSIVNYTVGGVTRQYQSLVSGNLNKTPTNTAFWVDITARLPFVVLTAATNIGGVDYPAGTYINTAFIADATIVSAKIKDLVADKITAGSLTAAIGVTTGRISGGVNTSFPMGSFNYGNGFFLGNDGGVYKLFVGDSTQNMMWNGSALSVTGNINALSGSFRNITIYDNNNNVVLSSGVGLGSLAYLNTVSASQVTDLGTLATQNSVDASQIDGLGDLASQDSVFIGQNVLLPDGNVMNTGDFVNRLSKINSSNISTFIANAAIGDAYIGNLNASKITAGTMAADRIGAGRIAVGSTISSSNFVRGSAGWQINGNGDAEMNSLIVRSGQITGAVMKALTVPIGFSAKNFVISFGTVITSSHAPYSLSGYSGGNAQWFIVWQGTMPASESTAGHRIAGLAAINSSSAAYNNNENDLVGALVIVDSIVGNAITGETISYGVSTNAYNQQVTIAGASNVVTTTAKTVLLVVTGFNSSLQVGTYSGLFWGVR